MRTISSPLGRLAACLLLAALLGSCLSIRGTGSRPSPPGRGGGIAVQVFADDDARRAGQLAHGIVAALERRDAGRWEPVFRSLGANWTVLGLAPGAYRLRFSGRLDAAGNVVPFAEEIRRVDVDDGEVQEITAVLEHVEPALVVAGVVTAVVAAILLEDWLDDHDLPTPPLPPPPSRAMLDAIFTVGVELALAPGCCADLPHGPAVTGHFPEDGAVIEVARPRVTFSFSAPLDPDRLGGDAITLVGEESGPVTGSLELDAARWWLVFVPVEPLPRPDTFTVTLQRSAVGGADGGSPPASTSFTFSTR